MTGLITDRLCLEHDSGLGHPECAARLRTVTKALAAAPGYAHLRHLTPRDATLAELQLCHDAAYLATAEADIRGGASLLRTGDTQVSSASWAAAVRAAGCALAATDAIMRGEVTNAFCASRPPGHHATARRGMGFCIVNHAAIAARYAQRKWGIQRVLIVDWDVHHGNGTQDIFYEDGSVFYFSTHQWPLYPGTGARTETGTGAGLGTTLNVPYPAGAGGKEILPAYAETLADAARGYRPELVIISAGFDARIDDPLGGLRLTDADFAQLTQIVGAIAQQTAEGRILSILEGGYNLDGLARAVCSHVGTLQSLAGNGLR